MSAIFSLENPPAPTTPAEWANSISAFAAAKSLECIEKEIKAKRASDIARDAVVIFADRTTSQTSAETATDTMTKAVAFAKLARALAEKEE